MIGKPPFETDSLKETYHKIRHNDYRIPSHISLEAKALITKLLRQDPSTRPTATEILSDPFFLSGFTPAKLPLRWFQFNEFVTLTSFCKFCSAV